jgi:hypothetical protein
VEQLGAEINRAVVGCLVPTASIRVHWKYAKNQSKENPSEITVSAHGVWLLTKSMQRRRRRLGADSHYCILIMYCSFPTSHIFSLYTPHNICGWVDTGQNDESSAQPVWQHVTLTGYVS